MSFHESLKTHGIIKNDKRGMYEAWCHGHKIGSISYGCKPSTIAIWKERYNQILKINEEE